MNSYKNERENEPEEESIFNDIELPEKPSDVHIVNARILLFCIAGVQLYNLYEYWPVFAGSAKIVQPILVVATFISIALWTRYNPLVALATALILWIAGNVIDFVVNGFEFGFTLILSTMVIVVLALGLRNAFEIKKGRKYT
jgi:hypothetical protein